MKISPRNGRAFSLTELLVVIGVLFVLAVLSSMPICGGGPAPTRGHLIQAVNNARQIHIATMSMANDGAANQDFGLGWPGDLKAHGKIRNIQDFVAILVKEDYLKPADLKVFAAAEIESYRPRKTDGTLVPPFEDKNSAFKVFLVRDADLANEVFLTSKNYTYNTALNPKFKPFGETGFVVARKNGDVSYYKKQQVYDLKIIGPLPGGATVESAANCLNPTP